VLARAILESECDEFLDVLCQSFEIEPTLAMPIFRRDPFFDINSKRALFSDDGRIESVLTIIPTSLRLGNGKIVPVAGIASVGTRPELRRQGLASRLIKDTLHSLAVDGRYSIAALEAHDPQFYRQFGFEHCSDNAFWRAHTTEIPSSSTPAKTLTNKEYVNKIDNIRQFYSREVERRPGAFLRGAQRWELIDAFYTGRHTALIEVGGKIEGYISFSSTDDENAVEIYDIVMEDRDHLYPLLAAPIALCSPSWLFGKIAKTKWIEWDLENEAGFERTLKPGVMLGCISPRHAISEALTGLNPLPGLPENGLQMVVTRGGNRLPLILSRRYCGYGVAHGSHVRDDIDTIELSGEMLIQIISGYRCATALHAENRIGASSPSALNAIDKLFEKSTPFLPALDAF